MRSQKSQTAAEEKVLKAGYVKSGYYSRDKDEALAEAKRLRESGKRATVIGKTYQGRVTSTVGYSIYTKEK